MSKNKKFNWIVGVDVAKRTLDFCLLNNSKEHYFFSIENSKKGIKSLIAKLKKEHNIKLNETLFCIEQTGSYSNILLYFLSEFNTNIWLETPIKIKQSSGVNRRKTDKTDALMIAQYASRFSDLFIAWKKPRKEIIELKRLIALREKIIQSIVRYKNPKTDFDFFESKENLAFQKKVYAGILNQLTRQKTNIENALKTLIQNDSSLKNTYKIVSSVVGMGFVSTIEIIANTNEFKNIKCPKKYACYSGIAPFEQSSGTALYKVSLSNLANKQAKKALHMGAMSAVTCSGELKEYYYRKLAQGKHKMSALNAVRNKIIHRVFACVKRNEPYRKEYTM